MATEPEKVMSCPSCGQPAKVEGNLITCTSCDVVYELRQKETKVKQVGVLEDHERRLKTIEEKLTGGKDDDEHQYNRHDDEGSDDEEEGEETGEVWPD